MTSNSLLQRLRACLEWRDGPLVPVEDRRVQVKAGRSVQFWDLMGVLLATPPDETPAQTSKTVNRWRIEPDGFDATEYQVDPTGEWVKYEDIKHLLAAPETSARTSEKQLFADVLVALEDLSFECDGVTSTKEPSIETYNRAFRVLDRARRELGIPVARAYQPTVETPETCNCRPDINGIHHVRCSSRNATPRSGDDS